MKNNKNVIPEVEEIIGRWGELRKLQDDFESSIEALEASIRARRSRMREMRKEEDEGDGENR
jgi:hypothetical protein